MALDFDSGAINALTREKFIPLLVDNIFNSNIMAQKYLANAEHLDGGRKIITPLEIAKASSYIGFYDDTVDGVGSTNQTLLTPATNTPFKQADWDWCQAYAGVTISNREIGMNSGDSQVLSILKAKLKNAQKSLTDLFGDAIFGSDTDLASTSHTSLCPVDNSTTPGDGDHHVFSNTYGRKLGNITSASSDYWDALNTGFTGGVDAGGVVLTANKANSTEMLTEVGETGVAQMIADMTTKYGECSIDGDQPDVIVTTQFLSDLYETALMNKKRFVGTETAIGGFTGLQFKNAVVVVDSHVPDGHMYFLNSNYIDYKVHGARNFAFEDFRTREEYDAQIARIFWMGQFVCTNPRMLGVLTAGANAWA